jgi:hypothetical protein
MNLAQQGSGMFAFCPSFGDLSKGGGAGPRLPEPLPKPSSVERENGRSRHIAFLPELCSPTRVPARVGAPVDRETTVGGPAPGIASPRCRRPSLSRRESRP